MKALPAGYDVDTHFKPTLQPLGPAPLPGPRRRSLQSRSHDGSAEIVTDRIETFTAGGIKLESGRRAGGRRRRHRDRAQPALPRRHAASRSTARSRTWPRALTYKGMMLERRPELRLHARLHQRLLDAEGRPRRRIRLPPAQPHGRQRLRRLRAARSATPASPRSRSLDFNSGYVLRSIDRPAEAGLEGAVEAAPELPGRPADAALRPGRRRRRCSSPARCGGTSRWSRSPSDGLLQRLSGCSPRA